MIERHIQTIKKCMSKCDISNYNFDLALLVLRSTPLGNISTKSCRTITAKAIQDNFTWVRGKSTKCKGGKRKDTEKAKDCCREVQPNEKIETSGEWRSACQAVLQEQSLMGSCCCDWESCFSSVTQSPAIGRGSSLAKEPCAPLNNLWVFPRRPLPGARWGRRGGGSHVYGIEQCW